MRSALKEAALRAPGVLDRPTREAIMGGAPVEGPLGDYAAAVRDHAHRVTDAQVAALSAAGVSGDAIYEATVSAAIGAGLLRFEKARAAMEAADEGP
jgi:hypothetical protein